MGTTLLLVLVLVGYEQEVVNLFLSKYLYSCKINSKYYLINNTLTGAVDLVETNIWHLINHENYNTAPIKTINNLIDRGYLYDNLEKEKNIFNLLYKNYIKKGRSRPLRFVFCPTYNCNLRCIYCFENFSSNSNKYMTTKLINYAVSAIKKISGDNEKIESFELFGGEPLLPKTKLIVEKILNCANEFDSTITIITNGTHAKDYINLLSPLKNKIEMLQITIDGPPAIHNKRRKYPSGKGSFSEISKSVDLLLKNNINTNVRVNIDNTNIDYLPNLYEYILKKKWLDSSNFKIMLSLVTDHSSLKYSKVIIPEEKLLKKLIKIYDKYPELEDLFGFFIFKPLRHLLDIINGAPNVSPKFFNCESNLLEMNVFCPDGNIYVCPESIGNKEMSIGKFYPKLTLYKDKQNMWTERSILNIKECKNCKFSPICGGGFTYSSILVYGNPNKPICERFQQTLDTFLELRGEKILKKFIN